MPYGRLWQKHEHARCRTTSFLIATFASFVNTFQNIFFVTWKPTIDLTFVLLDTHTRYTEAPSLPRISRMLFTFPLPLSGKYMLFEENQNKRLVHRNTEASNGQQWHKKSLSETKISTRRLVFVRVTTDQNKYLICPDETKYRSCPDEDKYRCRNFRDIFCSYVVLMQMSW